MEPARIPVPYPSPFVAYKQAYLEILCCLTRAKFHLFLKTSSTKAKSLVFNQSLQNEKTLHLQHHLPKKAYRLLSEMLSELRVLALTLFTLCSKLTFILLFKLLFLDLCSFALSL